MIDPKNCKTIDEVREAIDEIDNQIIELLGKRFSYVKEVPRFKKNTEESIVAKPRYNEVINSRVLIAEKHGLNGEVISKIYKELLEYFIEEQKKIINSQ